MIKAGFTVIIGNISHDLHQAITEQAKQNLDNLIYKVDLQERLATIDLAKDKDGVWRL
jgi:hypothetical protein